jgi:pyrroloquinoline quinone (PQQ) biosynthesis protein C
LNPPADALPAADFVAELRALARRHAIDPTLAQSLRYGRAELANVRRWAKDYFRYVEHDAQASAATLARCLDRELFLELSGHLARKTGFFQTGNALDLYRRFTDALGISREELDRHYACAETLGAMFTKRSFQHSSFLEGFVAASLVSEGALADASGDETPFLCQKGFAEYLRRAYSLPDGATDYWRAYEDFRSFDGERAWEILAGLCGDASSQAAIRRAFRHSLAVYQCARKAWSELAAGTYWDPELRWPSS